MTDPNACGNPRIDGLAHTRRLMDVWLLLERKFPEIKAKSYEVWLARRDGRIRRLVEKSPEYAALLANAGVGPQSDAEWAMLRDACLAAIRPQSHGAVTSGIGGSVAPRSTAA
jgi:hypothetical protein